MPEQIVTPEPTTELSLTDKIVGVLSSPGEVFQSIADTEPKASNWAVPLVLSMVFSILFVFVVFSQPPIQDQMADAQHKAIEKSIAEGKMTQEQADQMMEKNPAKPGSSMFMIFGSVGAVVVMAFALFVYSAVYLLGGKIVVKASAPYGKMLEVVGLSMYVGIIGAIITMVLVIAKGSLYASLSPALFMADFDPMNKQHKLLAAINLLEFWNLAVVGIGLSKVWKTTMGKAFSVVGGVWLAWTLIKVFGNFGGGM